MIDKIMYYIFFLGAILTFFYYIEEAIENQEYKEKSLLMMAFLAFVKSVIGGILIVLIFFTLQELKLEFDLIGIHIKLDLWANVLISATFSLFGSDIFKIFKRRLEKTVGGGSK